LGKSRGEDRHKRGTEGPLGKKPAEKIGQLQGNEKTIRHKTRAQYGSRQYIPHKTQNPAYEGEAAKDGNGFC